MTIIQVPVLEKTFGVTIYAIDRANRQFYLVEGTKLMALNLYGFLDERDWPDTPNIPTQAPIPSQGPQSTLTLITRVEDLQLRTEPDEGQATGNTVPMRSTSSAGIITPLDFSNTISWDKYQEAIRKEPSVSTMDPEETIITDEEYEEIVERLAKIGKKISILMMNWSAELQETHNEQDKKEADRYY